MRIEVPYGKEGHQSLTIPEANYLGTLRPNELPHSDEQWELDRALQNPISSDRIEDFLRGGKDIVFIVNDGTRPTPTASVLRALSKRIDLKGVRFLIATGIHREPTEDEYRMIFGELYDSLKDQIHSHDSRKDPMVLLGHSKNGTEMSVNEIAVNADRLVIITSVEPHYFAGYTGGRKSFLPGVASYRTIEQNHKLAMGSEAQAIALAGNPVHEDMMDALQMVKGKKIFSIQAVLDRHQHVYRVAAGDLNLSFDQAVKWANDVFSVEIGEKADVVVSVAQYPMDIDLYQSQKALDNGKWALKEGGTLILVSKCRKGVGDEVFCNQLSLSTDPFQILKNLTQEYKLGYHKAAKVAEIMTWAKISAVTDLDPALIRRINMMPFKEVQSAVDQAIENGPESKVMVILDGSVLVPRLVQQ
ncbi:MAG TPA: nickel-dependent lactate racemase [Methanomassiliicoccales archaeon]|jgi:nickel-dependent lactate racemase